MDPNGFRGVDPNVGYLVLVVLALATLGVLLWGRRSRRPKFFARAEYWVYVPGTKLPKQDELMTRMVAENPLHRLGKPPIGAREGLLFSDIRLHLAMAIRSKKRTHTSFDPICSIPRSR